MSIANYPTYDSYKDSGVEWLDSIPQSWETRKLKFVTQIMKRIAGREGPDVLSITQRGIKVKDITSGEGQLAEDYSNYQIVCRGDFAMNHMDLLTGYVDISQFDGVVSPDYRVFRRTSDELDDRYLLLIFQIGYKQRIFFRYGQGVSLLGRWRFPAENFKEFQVPIPPLPEQRSIAVFLDEKCAKVDEAVRIKEEQIALLRERRQILIQQAVTRGLNHAVAMKDSGIDWIGQIPAHWGLQPMRAFFRFRNEKNYPVKTENILSLSIAHGVTPYSEAGRGGNKRKDDLTAYKLAYPGDIVLNSMNVIVGAVGRSKYFGAISPVYYAFYPVSDEVYVPFYEQIFLNASFQRGLLRLGKGILIKLSGTGQLNTIRMKISTNDLKGLLFPAPPQDEQAEIVDFIDAQNLKIDSAISIKEEQIAALKEYKTNLINAAVTGKIKVI